MKRLKLILITFLILTGITFQEKVSAQVEQKGTIAISPTYNGVPVVGGDLLVYQVANWSEKDSRFAFTKEFSSTALSLEHLISPELDQSDIQVLVNNSHHVKPYQYIDSIPQKGVILENLSQGIYLFVQKESAQGYEKMNPFVISIPNNGSLSVEAKEKMSPISSSASPSKIVSSKDDVPREKVKVLPFTGQVWWPVYLSLVCGIICLVLSMIGKKND